MKYRRLRTDELIELESEFTRFLASQAIPASEWESIKSNRPDQADELIDIFSDMVFEQILNKVEYLELKGAKDLKTIHCLPEKMVMLGILIEGNTSFNLTQDLSPEQMIQQIHLTGAKVKLYSAEKAYDKERPVEIFDWMERGALISKDGHLFKTLDALKG